MNTNKLIHASWGEEATRNDIKLGYYGCFQAPSCGIKYVRDEKNTVKLRKLFLKKDDAEKAASRALLKELNGETQEPKYKREHVVRNNKGKKSLDAIFTRKGGMKMRKGKTS